MQDFTELGVSVPVAMLMQEMNEKKSLLVDDFDVCLPNLACYFKCVQVRNMPDRTFGIVAGVTNSASEIRNGTCH